MQRLQNVWKIIQFAAIAIWNVLREQKMLVTWKRDFKTVVLCVQCYNHLFEEEQLEQIKTLLEQEQP